MKYQAQDFKSNQQVRWCPGCGDHAVLAALQRALPSVAEALDLPKEKFVVVSGIGCSSRLPYYMDTFGFHGIHGRATALSTGLKVARPELSVWQACGDGDALAIGGNHFIHAIRRNVDLNIILFNNQIYGLTKGQYSPTSKFGAITKTSPYGTVENPFTPGQLVIGARGTFFARGLDVDIKNNPDIFLAAALHKGASVCEMLVNCMIFNDGAHAAISAREVRADKTIFLRDGEKMIFGANNDKGLVLENGSLKAVTIGQDGYTMDDILVHHADTRDTFMHSMLIDMKGDLPVALGVIRNVEDSTYDENVEKQLQEVSAAAKVHSVDELLRSGSTWEVK